MHQQDEVLICPCEQAGSTPLLCFRMCFQTSGMDGFVSYPETQGSVPGERSRKRKTRRRTQPGSSIDRSRGEGGGSPRGGGGRVSGREN